jgi:arabinofuranosyltransferase
MPFALHPAQIIQRAAPWVFACLLLHHAVHYAWVAEDAFINFRVIANVLDHQGLTWNPSERVQVFTSPLWMGLSVAMTALQGDPIESSIWLSFGVFTLAMGLLWQACGRRTVLWLITAALWCSSRSVRDYMCSGLETPLVMAAVAAAVTLPALWPRLSVRALGTLLSLCILVRHDLLLLLGPVVFHTAWRGQGELAPVASGLAAVWRLARELVIGSWPLLAWSAWAWLYYGSPLPNTALAKMVSGWNGPEQAWFYYGVMQHFDPLLMALIAIGLGITWACRGRQLWPTTAGLALFTLYLAHIGGDYMAGRFMVGPVTLCVFVAASAVHTLLSQARTAGALAAWTEPLGSTWRRAQPAALLSTLLAFGTATWFPQDLWNEVTQAEILHDVIDSRQSQWGISDLRTLSSQGVPKSAFFRHNAIAIAEAMKGQTAPTPAVFISCAIGMTGYFAPRQAHIVDPLALADRFLAGLPLTTAHRAHIGHFERPVPSDYVASLLSGRNAFSDPVLAAYHEDVQRVLRGPLLDGDRLGAIWRLSTGHYRARLARWQATDGGGTLVPNADRVVGKPPACLGGVTKVTQARLVNGQITLNTLPTLPALQP